MITAAFTFFIDVIASSVQEMNYAISLGNYSFGLLDFLVVTTLLGIVVRNFVHSAK